MASVLESGKEQLGVIVGSDVVECRSAEAEVRGAGGGGEGQIHTYLVIFPSAPKYA